MADGLDSARRILTFTSTCDPSRLTIVMRRSTVNRPRSALRTREKSAAAKPVRACAARTLRPARSSDLMISAARIALNWAMSAFGDRGDRDSLICVALFSDSFFTAPGVYLAHERN